ncbi:MAG TPA: VIT1/CCC1 family protein [Stellaceae bacterium]|jgi:VIT1/CCC1 family predicted Fe2+/Mn2+ transporter|nr:VIT1/CCC1 family protein [Stellaceae bacterium]
MPDQDPNQNRAERYRSNLQDELDSAALYRVLAESEATPQMREVYRRLAAIEEKHAALWREQLAQVGESAGRYRAGLRTRLLAWLARQFGAGLVLPMVAAIERGDQGMYDDQPEARAAGLPGVERSHSRVLQAAARPIRGGLSGSALAQIEGRHHTGGNALRAAVLGANDGLVSNLSLVMGVAGAEFSGKTVLITGLAGLLAGACSMAMGEWLSVTSARELYTRQIATEKAELEEMPEEEREELELIYQAKGLPVAEAKRLAARIIANPETALDTLAREELGIDPGDLGGSPWTAAGTSFLLFALGAIFPVAPFFFLSGAAVIITSLVLSACAMFAIGAGTTLFTGRGMVFSGTRQVAIGGVAAAVTFGLGRLIGVGIGG